MRIVWETSAIKRKGKLDAATLVQMMIFGFWQDPDIRLSGLAQIGFAPIQIGQVREIGAVLV